MGRTWTPTMVYNSEWHSPFIYFAADVSLSSSTTIDLLDVVAIINGDTTSRDFVLPNDGQARRVVIVRDTDEVHPNLPTGVYPYTIQVRAWSGGVQQAIASDTGTLTIVRRKFGYSSGWWLSGLEQLSGNGTWMLWIGGDGSARRYKQSGSTNYWLATPVVDRPDTLERLVNSITETEEGFDTTWKYRRRIPNNAYVEFDPALRHVKTVNSQGLTTRFAYSGPFGYSPDSIVLPVPSGSSIKRAYKFEYLFETTYTPYPTYSVHHRVSAPTVNGQSRITEFWLPWMIAIYGTPSAAAAIVGPNNDSTLFNGANIRDRAGRVESFGMSYGLLSSVSDVLWTDPEYIEPDTVVQTTFRNPHIISIGCTWYLQNVCGGFFTPTNVYTIVDGPRSDINDTVRFRTNRFGAPTFIRDPLGNETTITYGDSRFPSLVTSVVKPNGFTQTQAFNSRGLVDSSVAVSPYGGGNAITKYTWHSSRPLVTERRDPAGGLTSFSYDGAGNRSWQQVGTSSSTRVSFEYDGENRLTHVQPPNHTSGQREHIEYDALLGNVSRVTTPIGFYTDYTTDSIGRVTITSSPFDSANTTRLVDTTVYNILSWPVVSKRGALRDSTKYNPEGQVLERRQYSNGSLVSAFTYAYDKMGRLSGENGPAGSRAYHRDLAGNDTLRAGVKMQYDALGRLTRRIAPGSSSGATCHPMKMSIYSEGCSGSDLAFPMYGGSTFVVPTDTALFTYDANGALLTADNIDGRIKRSYYANGQLKTDTLRIRTYTRTSDPNTDFATHAYALQYEYDLAGRRQKLYHPTSLGYGCGGSCYQSYTYDTLTGRLTSTASIRGHSFSFGYDDQGRVTSTSGPGGTNQSFTYDLDGRMTQRLDRRGIGTVDTVHRDWRSFDAAGRILKDTTAGLSAFRQVTTNTYSTLGQLTQSIYHQLSPDKTLTESWTVDGIGNITTYTKSTGTTTKVRSNAFDAGENWQQSSTEYASYGAPPIDNVWYGQDSYGRMTQQLTSRTIPGAWPPVEARVYTWSWYDGTGEGKMYGFQRQGPDSAVDTRAVFEEYRYDALGRRIMLRSRPSSVCNLSVAPYCRGVIERHVWDGAAVLYEIRVPGENSASSNALEVDTASGPHYGRVGYVHAGGIDTPLAVDRDGLVVVPHTNWRGLYDTGTDTLGATCCSTVDWVGRDATAYLEGGLLRNPTGWAGSLITSRQDQSGLLYRVNRYYDPASGRFTQSDPIGIRGGLNTFGFGGSDPINRSDPLGLLYADRGACSIIAYCPRNNASDWGDAMMDEAVDGGGPGDGVVRFAKCIAAVAMFTGASSRDGSFPDAVADMAKQCGRIGISVCEWRG